MSCAARRSSAAWGSARSPTAWARRTSSSPWCPSGADGGGHRGHGVVERDRVGLVEDHEHLTRARGAPVEPDLDLPSIHRSVVVGDRTVRVGVQPGLVDQHPDPVRVQPARLPRQQPVRMTGRSQGQVARLPRRLPAEVDRDPQPPHQTPQPRQPVRQVQHVTQQRQRRLVGQVQHRGELHHAELRHQRRPLAGERDGTLPEQRRRSPGRTHRVGAPPRDLTRIRVRGHHVRVRPRQRRLQHLDLRPPPRAIAAAARSSATRSVTRVSEARVEVDMRPSSQSPPTLRPAKTHLWRTISEQVT